MSESLIASSYLAVITVGLIHGLEPGHGWPVAALLSTTVKRRYGYGVAAGAILSAGHFVSSLAVVVIYYVISTFFGTYIDFTGPWFKILTAAALLILAYRFFKQKEHVHGPHGEHLHTDGGERNREHANNFGQLHSHGEGDHHVHFGGEQKITGLKGLATFAFVLGFAHEEEFMLFALFVGGVNPLLGMTLYAAAVTFSLMTITLVAIKAFSTIEMRMRQYRKYIPKITALVLSLLAVLFLLPVLGGPTIY